MEEKYLHYLWRYKRIPFQALRLTSGQPVKIISFGTYNATSSGPDFSAIHLKIGDLEWIGNMEMHVKSSDWYAHEHHVDSAYNNVVLHIVYQHDEEVLVNGSFLPVIELKSFIDQKHYNQFKRLSVPRKVILCGSQIAALPSAYLLSMIDKALFERLDRKTAHLQFGEDEIVREQLYQLMAKAMGSHDNQLPFEELATKVNLRWIKKFAAAKRHKIVLLTSGLFQPDSVEDLDLVEELYRKNDQHKYAVMNASSWKRGGIRPGNQPGLRILQFAGITADFDFNYTFSYLPVDQLYAYLLELLNGFFSDDRSLKLSVNFKNQLIVNCFVPFIYWLGKMTDNSDLQEKAIDLLCKLPAEINTITRQWNAQGVQLNDAAYSQGLLELHHSYCSEKKCLTCAVGIQLLKE